MTDAPISGLIVSMISYGLPHQTTTRLFNRLEEGFKQNGVAVYREARTLPSGLLRKFVAVIGAQCRSLQRIRRSTALIIHTPLAVSCFSVVASRALGTPVIAFVWDIYPESTAHAGGGRGRLATAVYWILERTSLALATSIIVPSHDYVAPINRWKSKIKEIPLWPSDPVTPSPLPPVDRELSSSGVLKVGFAGQINAIRSLSIGADTLLRVWPGQVELHVFSDDETPPDLVNLATDSNRFDVIHHGSLPAAELQSALSQLDVGWVCLDPEFSMPAFPSKSLAYIAAGLPVWFNGPALPGYRRWLIETGMGLCIDELEQPQDVSQVADLHSGFLVRRDSYLHRMEHRWFCLEALL